MSTPDHDLAAEVARTHLGIPPPDLNAALTVETTVTLTDHEGLGIVVSELTSDQQADFLTGLAEGFSRYDSAARRRFQYAFIADEFKTSPGIARGLIELLRDLADQIEEVSK